MYENATRTISFRVTPSLKEKLEEFCKKNGLKYGNNTGQTTVLTRALEYYLDNYATLKKSKQK